MRELLEQLILAVPNGTCLVNRPSDKEVIIIFALEPGVRATAWVHSRGVTWRGQGELTYWLLKNMPAQGLLRCHQHFWLWEWRHGKPPIGDKSLDIVVMKAYVEASR